MPFFLSVPATAFNPKLCFIEIGPQGSSITQADKDLLAAAITDATSDTGLPPFPKSQPTPRQYVYGSYVDEPLMMKAGGSKYYYASNHLYSVAALTDANGQVVERYKYDAYGRQGILASNGVVSYTPSDYGQFVGFTGRYHDWETGLIYFRARYYSAELGRFIGRDPAGDVDGMGLYGAYFVPNGVDPSGSLVIFVHGIGDTQHRDKAPLLYTGMIESWRRLGQPTQGMTHFLYGPAGKLDPMREDTARNKAAAKALKDMVESIQKVRDKITPCPKDQEPIYIYAYSNGSIVIKLALEMGMKVDGVVFSGAAVDSDTDLTKAKAGTPWIYNFHSDEDGTNVMVDGAGRNGFTTPPAGVVNIPVPKVDHYIDDGLNTASDAGRVNGFTEWDSRYMGNTHGPLLNPNGNNSLSTGMQYTYPDGTVRPAMGYNPWESGVK